MTPLERELLRKKFFSGEISPEEYKRALSGGAEENQPTAPISPVTSPPYPAPQVEPVELNELKRQYQGELNRSLARETPDEAERGAKIQETLQKEFGAPPPPISLGEKALRAFSPGIITDTGETLAEKTGTERITAGLKGLASGPRLPSTSVSVSIYGDSKVKVESPEMQAIRIAGTLAPAPLQELYFATGLPIPGYSGWDFSAENRGRTPPEEVKKQGAFSEYLWNTLDKIEKGEGLFNDIRTVAQKRGLDKQTVGEYIGLTEKEKGLPVTRSLLGSFLLKRALEMKLSTAAALPGLAADILVNWEGAFLKPLLLAGKAAKGAKIAGEAGEEFAALESAAKFAAGKEESAAESLGAMAKAEVLSGGNPHEFLRGQALDIADALSLRRFGIPIEQLSKQSGNIAPLPIALQTEKISGVTLAQGVNPQQIPARDALATITEEAIKLRIRSTLGERTVNLPGGVVSSTEEAPKILKETEEFFQNAGIDRRALSPDKDGLVQLPLSSGPFLGKVGAAIPSSGKVPVEELLKIEGLVTARIAGEARQLRNSLREASWIGGALQTAFRTGAGGRIGEIARDFASAFGGNLIGAAPEVKALFAQARRDFSSIPKVLQLEVNQLASRGFSPSQAAAQILRGFNLVNPNFLRNFLTKFKVTDPKALSQAILTHGNPPPELLAGLRSQNIPELDNAIQSYKNWILKEFNTRVEEWLQSHLPSKLFSYGTVQRELERLYTPDRFKIYQELIQGKAGPATIEFLRRITPRAEEMLETPEVVAFRLATLRRVALEESKFLEKLKISGIGVDASGDPELAETIRRLLEDKTWYFDEVGNKVALAGESKIALAKRQLRLWGIPEGSGSTSLEEVGLPGGKVQIPAELKAEFDRLNKLGMSDAQKSFLERVAAEKVGDRAGAASSLLVNFYAQWKRQLLGGLILPRFGYHIGNLVGLLPMSLVQLGAKQTARTAGTIVKHREVLGEMLKRTSQVGFARSPRKGEIFRTAAGTPIDDDTLEKLIITGGVDSTFGTVETAKRVSEEIFKDNPTLYENLARGWNGWHDMWLEVSSGVERAWRIGTFLDILHSGKSAEEAQRLGRESLFDYSTLTDFEKNFVKVLVPFWGFTRKNLDSFWGAILRGDLNRINAQYRFLNAQRDLYEQDPFEQANTKESAGRLIAFDWGPVMRPDGSLDPRYSTMFSLAGSPLPASDALMFSFRVGKLLGLQAEEADKAYFLKQGNPLLKQPIAERAGVDPATGYPIDSDRANVIPEWIIALSPEFAAEFFGAKEKKLLQEEQPEAASPSLFEEGRRWVATGDGQARLRLFNLLLQDASWEQAYRIFNPRPGYTSEQELVEFYGFKGAQQKTGAFLLEELRKPEKSKIKGLIEEAKQKQEN